MCMFTGRGAAPNALAAFPLSFARRSDASVLYPGHEGQSEGRDGLVPVAAGDLKCIGGVCSEGGTRGATAMYRINDRPTCPECAIKHFSLEGMSPAEQIKYLRPFLPKDR